MGSAIREIIGDEGFWGYDKRQQWKDASYVSNANPQTILAIIERLRDAEEAMRQASDDLYHGPVGQPYDSERMIDSYFEKWGNDQ